MLQRTASRSIPSVVALLSLAIVTGCLAQTPSQPGPLSAIEGLSPDDQEIARLLAFIVAANRGEGAVGTTRTTQTLPAIEAQAIGPFYAGPYPAASGSLPASYRVRATGDWLKTNPATASVGGGVSTETYYSEGGQPTQSYAYTREVRSGVATTFSLYAGPSDTIAALPAFFRERVELPAAYTVGFAEETYHVLAPGQSALGYRFSVHDVRPGVGLTAWIRAYRVAASGGKTLHKYELFSRYALVNGAPRPTRYAYGVYDPITRSGSELREDLDFNACEAQAQGAWHDLANDKHVTYVQTLAPDASLRKEITYAPSPDRVYTTLEEYRPDGSGQGAISLNGVQRGTLRWSASGVGEVSLESGRVKYGASRQGLPPYTSLCAGTDAPAGGPLTSASTLIIGSFLDAIVIPPNGPGESALINGSFTDPAIDPNPAGSTTSVNGSF